MHITIGNDGYYHPASERELLDLIRWAADDKLQLRVRGATHAFPNRSIFTDQDPGKSDREINVMLDRYRKVTWLDESRGLVEVESGCHLSRDPYDPTGTSSLENGLLFQLQEKGWTLAVLGGITHQTVGGFLSTGSSGGCVKYGLADNIESVRFVDGTGQVHVASSELNAEQFHALGISMGLLGVLSTVTFRCTPTFNIQGRESTSGEDDCKIDLFGEGNEQRPSLQTFLTETEYTRIVWWPQAGVQRVVVWEAQRIAPSRSSSLYLIANSVRTPSPWRWRDVCCWQSSETWKTCLCCPRSSRGSTRWSIKRSWSR